MTNPLIQYGDIKELLQVFLKTHAYSQIAILVDENTKEHCLPLIPEFDNTLIEIKSGESFKNLDTCSSIWASLLDAQFNRNSLLINLGGGVITDMGGFSASCFKRGIDFINIPTTLLAMVDASAGSKTGIDFKFQKNMIGLFSEAKQIFIDANFLKTLEERQILSGKAEMLKHGLIADRKHFNSLLNVSTPSLQLIQDSVNIKLSIVNQDPFENGIRKTLNFGHTLGHALESFFLKQSKDILHGEAVAQGMIWAIKLSLKYCKFNEATGNEIIEELNKIYGNIELNKTDFEVLISLSKNDKKNIGQGINFCLLESENRLNTSVSLSKEEIVKALFEKH